MIFGVNVDDIDFSKIEHFLLQLFKPRILYRHWISYGIACTTKPRRHLQICHQSQIQQKLVYYEHFMQQHFMQRMSKLNA